MLLSSERPFVGAFAFCIPGATLLHRMVWYKQSCRRRIGTLQTDHRGSPGTWESPTCSSGNSRLETPVYQLQALAAHSSARERTKRVKPRYRQAKETKCGEMAVGCRSALIVPLKLGNSPWRTQWRKAKRRPADSIEGNMLNTSRFLSHVNVTRLNSFGDREDGEAVGPRNRMP